MAYSEWNYQQLLTQLQELLEQEDSPWGEVASTSVGATIMRMFAFSVDVLMYNVERRSEEGFISTATLRSSVVNLAKLVGYTPRRKVSAVGRVLFKTSTGTPATTQIDIPVNTVVSSAGGIDFVTTGASSIALGSTYSGDINDETTWTDVKQGTVQSVTDIGDNTSYQYIDIPTDGSAVDDIETTSIAVTVDGTTWTEVENYYEAEDTNFIIETYGTKIRIKFGNGINGTKPQNGSSIVVSWLESEGSAGNILSADFVNQTSLASVSVDQSTLMLGGEAEESTEEIKQNAPQVWASQGRVVTIADYISYISAYSGIETANVWGEQEEITVTGGSQPLTAWRVKISAIPTRGTGATIIPTFVDTALQESLDDALQELKCVTAELRYIEPDPIRLLLTGQVKVSTGSTWTAVSAAIDTALEQSYSSWNSSLSFEESIKRGDIIQKIENIDGVDFTNNINVVHYIELSEYGGSPALSWNGTMNVLPQPNTIEVGVIHNGVWEVWGWDNGTGGFTGPKVTSGTVAYDTGVLVVTLASVVDSGDTVFCRAIGVELFDDYTAATGDGSTEIFRFNLRSPIFASAAMDGQMSFVYTIGDTAYTATDNGAGTISGTNLTTGRVNYNTGEVYLEFASAPDSGSAIYVDYYAATQNYTALLENVLILDTIALTGSYS